MGMYEYRVTRRGRSAEDQAVRLAKQRADRKGIRLYGEPIIEKKRVPVPVIGPRTRYVVRFAASREARHAKRSDEAVWTYP